MKLAERLQLLPGLTDETQEPMPVTANGAGALAEVMMSGAVPVFLTTMFLGTVRPTRTPLSPPKFVSAVVAVVAVADAAIPVPVAVTLKSDPSALWKILILIVFRPAVMGANWTLAVQELPGSTVAQPFDNEHCAVLPARSAGMTVNPDPTCAGGTAACKGSTPTFIMAINSAIGAAFKVPLPITASLRRALAGIFHSSHY